MTSKYSAMSIQFIYCNLIVQVTLIAFVLRYAISLHYVSSTAICQTDLTLSTLRFTSIIYLKKETILQLLLCRVPD